MRRAAPAKLNLALHITGRRADGYHLLESLVAFTDIADTLSAAPADSLTLEYSGLFASALPADPRDNLIWRAAEALRAHGGVTQGAAIRLDKQLPVGSGIGSGSTDAAAALHLLAELWNVPLPPVLALSLGSDLPACLAGTPALMRGVGEILEPVTLPPLPVVLIHPGPALLTADVYRAREGAFDAPMDWPRDFAGADELLAFLARTRNALQTPATAQLPVIAEMLAHLSSQPGCALARMSGSGPTCFGIFANDAQAAQAQSAIASAQPGWWVRAGNVSSPCKGEDQGGGPFPKSAQTRERDPHPTFPLTGGGL